MFVNELKSGGVRAMLAADPTLFDNFELFDDLSGAEQLVIDRIIYKYGDTPLFTPDPEVLKYYIGLWAYRRNPLWLRYYNTEFTEYNPIENYNRYEKGTNTVENEISADNATTYQPDNKVVATPDLHTYGNIGVTTTQQMLNQELDIIPKLDCIDFIADDFKSEFCLYVY